VINPIPTCSFPRCCLLFRTSRITRLVIVAITLTASALRRRYYERAAGIILARSFDASDSKRSLVNARRRSIFLDSTRADLAGISLLSGSPRSHQCLPTYPSPSLYYRSCQSCTLQVPITRTGPPSGPFLSPSRPSAVSLGFFYFRERRTEDRSATSASFKETR